jgi:hypothetical protein
MRSMVEGLFVANKNPPPRFARSPPREIAGRAMGVRRKLGTPCRKPRILSWRKAGLPYDDSIEG